VKIVLDTNVLVSAFLNPRGRPADVLNLIINDEAVICFDDRIMNEYKEVLSRYIFGFNISDVNSVISYFKHSGERVDPSPLDIKLNDPDDAMFYEVMIASGASYLVTGNIRHFNVLNDNRIVVPADFLREYFKSRRL